MAPAFSTARSPSGSALHSAQSSWAEMVEQISTCARLLRRGLGHALTPYEISESQFSVLWACSKAPAAGVAQSELAGGLSLSPAHVSGIVEQLRDRGWIDCHRGTADRRRQLWQCTPAGRELLTQLKGAVDLMLDRAEQQSDDTTRRAAQTLLSTLGQAAALQASTPTSAPRLKLAALPYQASQDGETAPC